MPRYAKLRLVGHLPYLSAESMGFTSHSRHLWFRLSSRYPGNGGPGKMAAMDETAKKIWRLWTFYRPISMLLYLSYTYHIRISSSLSLSLSLPLSLSLFGGLSLRPNKTSSVKATSKTYLVWEQHQGVPNGMRVHMALIKGLGRSHEHWRAAIDGGTSKMAGLECM